MLRDQVAAYGAESPAAALRSSRPFAIDASLEAFVGEGAAAANAFLGPREFRTPYVLEAIAGA